MQKFDLHFDSQASAHAVGEKIRITAVIGPNANYSINTHYYGPRVVCGNKLWTALDAVSKYAGASTVMYAAGVPNATSNDTSMIPAAVATAQLADTVVLVVGTSLYTASEGHDATQINFTAAQQQLIEETLKVAKNPVVVLLMTAVPLDISQLLASPKVGAVLHLGQPSVTVLGAAELLYGNVSPAGRTVQTFYQASYQDQISIFDFNMRPGPSTFARPDCSKKFNPAACPRGTNPGRTHRFYTGVESTTHYISKRRNIWMPSFVLLSAPLVPGAIHVSNPVLIVLYLQFSPA